MSKAYFRFYEELNEYLPKEKYKVWFEYEFEKEYTINNVVKTLGVPKSKIDLVLVNQKTVKFNHKIQDGDRISVFPVFELLDISGINKLRKKPLRDTKFICDNHLGKLCKYLRMLGFDTLYSNQYTYNQIIDIALNEKRIILSRNVKMIKHEKVNRFYWIRSSIPKEQLLDIVFRMDLINSFNLFTICLQCNNRLTKINKQEILGQLDIKTAKYFNDFYLCSTCDKIYWKGSHYQNMLDFIQQNILLKINK